MSVAPIRQLKNQASHFEPYEQNFSYTGAMQTWVVPSTGVYMIELYGASGGTGNQTSGANGAYVKSYHRVRKNEVYYIGVGGAGASRNHVWNEQASTETLYGGFNGGGNGYYLCNNNYERCSYGGGGGATHMSKENVIIQNTQDVDNILCVAGGGGGGGAWYWASETPPSGSRPGTSTAQSNGTLGRGSDYYLPDYQGYAAGGGGRYGGMVTYSGTNLKASYGSYTATETQGNNSGNGKVKITRVK